MPNLRKLALITGASAAVALMSLTTGCQMMHHESEGGRTAGRVLDDKTITANVKHKLNAEPVYKFTDVDVKTFDGVVQLSGFVTSQDQKQRAGELAQNVDGVTRVVNNITIQPTGNLTPTGRKDINEAQPAPAPQEQR